MGNPGPGWDRHVNVERINQSNESHPFPLNNWMSNDYAYIYLYVNVSEILQEREGHDIENILQLLKMRKLHWSRKTQKTQRLGKFHKEKACRPLLVQLQSVEAKITIQKCPLYESTPKIQRYKC